MNIAFLTYHPNIIFHLSHPLNNVIIYGTSECSKAVTRLQFYGGYQALYIGRIGGVRYVIHSRITTIDRLPKTKQRPAPRSELHSSTSSFLLLLTSVYHTILTSRQIIRIQLSASHVPSLSISSPKKESGNQSRFHSSIFQNKSKNRNVSSENSLALFKIRQVNIYRPRLPWVRCSSQI